MQFQASRLPASFDRARADRKQFARLGVAKSLIPDQIEDLAFLFRQRLDLLMKFTPQGQPARLQRACRPCRSPGTGPNR